MLVVMAYTVDSKFFTALKFVYSRLFLHFTTYTLVGKVKDEQ